MKQTENMDKYQKALYLKDNSPDGTEEKAEKKEILKGFIAIARNNLPPDTSSLMIDTFVHICRQIANQVEQAKRNFMCEPKVTITINKRVITLPQLNIISNVMRNKGYTVKITETSSTYPDPRYYEINITWRFDENEKNIQDNNSKLSESQKH